MCTVHDDTVHDDTATLAPSTSRLLNMTGMSTNDESTNSHKSTNCFASSHTTFWSSSFTI